MSTAVIPGDPAAVEAAAATLRSAAGDFTDTADAIGSHRRALTAEWIGAASDAAADALDQLSTRTRVGHDVAAGAAGVLTVYAATLRTAQRDYADAASAAASAATASGTSTDAPGADAQAAADAADAALALAAAADAQAAAAIDALTAQLSAMTGASTAETASETAAHTTTGHPSAHQASDHGGGWLHSAWSWTEDHADDISSVAGTAAFVAAFIPGVDLIATPLLTGIAVAAGAVATAHDVREGENGKAVEDGAFTILDIVPGVGAVKALSRIDDAGRLITAADDLERTGITVGENTAIGGPVYVKAPPNPTPEDIASARAYTQGANEALEADALSSTGRVSTKGGLRFDANKAIDVEKARAEAAGTPYLGVAGHVPDTTWTGTPEPHSWLDMPSRVNSSIGGQANGYPLGYLPTEFIFIEPGE